MYSLAIEHWEEIHVNELNQGIYLWIFHADKIPPHIGISKDGIYFSLKVTGKDTHIPVPKVVHILDKKKIPTILIRTSHNSIQTTDLQNVYTKYENANQTGISCLTPITEIYFSTPLDLILSELVNLLNEAGVVEKFYGRNLTTDFKGVPYYTKKEVIERLENLSHAIKRS
jgi:hypothetical protein